MATNSWHPLFSIKVHLFFNQFKTSQLVPSISCVHTSQPISQPPHALYQVSQSMQAEPLTKLVPPVFATSQFPLTLPLQGSLQTS